MRSLANLLDRVPVDNKLLAAFVSLIVTRVAVGLLGVDPDDELLALGLPLLTSALVGYGTPNEATVLREGGDDGNAVLPDDEAVAGEAA